jgi:threonine dehydratase
MLTLPDIRSAHRSIQPYIHRTPLIHSRSLSLMTGAEVHLKLENLQKTGSFKARGAFHKLFSVKESKVIAASMGNHAQAVAFAAKTLGKKATIVMPATASIVKEEAARAYGAEVVLTGERLSDALAYAEAQKGHVFIHPFDDDAVIAGQGTIGIEIAEDLAEVDAVLVPVGGGGLIAGTAAAIKALSPKTRVIGVQSEAAPSASRSFAGKTITEQTPQPTIADGIAVGRVGERTFEVIARHVDEMLLVDDDAVARAILLLLERKKLVVEGAGAVTLAALLNAAGRFPGKRVVLVLSGGNIDFTVVDRIIRKGLVTSGRVAMFAVTITDAPGNLCAVTGIIAAQRANVLDVAHDRLAGDLAIGRTRVVFTVEIRGRKHLEEVLAALKARGYEAKEKG